MSGAGISDRRAVLRTATEACARRDWMGAERLCRLLLQTDPDDFDALGLIGVAAAQTSRPREAARWLARAVELRPGDAGALGNYANVLSALGRLEEAVALYDRAIECQPGNAEIYKNRGAAQAGLGQLDAAMESYRRALALRPGYAQAHNNLGNAFARLERFPEAVAQYDAAIERSPSFAMAHFNRGVALKRLNRLVEAIASFDAAIAHRPGYADAHWSKGLSLLLAGDLAQGWPLYEWRWDATGTGLARRELGRPRWHGEASLGGKTVLLHAEQGLGDTIQFARFARPVAALGARVVLEVPGPLVALMSSLEGPDEVVERGAALPAFDRHCPLPSLPLALGTTLASLPAPAPYVQVEPRKRAAWAGALGARRGLRIGLAWSGEPSHRNDRHRSVALSALLPHLPGGAELVSLQKDVREADRAALTGSAVRHFGDRLADFSDTAALCEQVDVVVSVDTSVAHLSGALARPTWVLLPFAPDWRWLLGRDDSPWYPTARLYRQPGHGDWERALRRLGADLAALAAAR